MAFPATVYTDNNAAASGFVSNAITAGLSLSGLNPLAQLQSAVANLLIDDPSTIAVPAGDVLSGTFGANKAGGADTGTYTFPGAVVITTTGSLTGLTYTTSLVSATALATPGAFVATRAAAFASTVSGAAIMGFGTTNDVTLMNRAGTAIIGITANTTGVTMAGALAITGALSGVTTLNTSGLATLGAGIALTGTLTMATAASLLTPGATSFNITNTAGSANNLTILDAGGITLGNPAAGATQQVVIAGTAYGAGVASLRLNGLTTAAVASQTGTLTNAPSVGNPTFWCPVSIAGAIRYIPMWS